MAKSSDRFTIIIIPFKNGNICVRVIRVSDVIRVAGHIQTDTLIHYANLSNLLYRCLSITIQRMIRKCYYLPPVHNNRLNNNTC